MTDAKELPIYIMYPRYELVSKQVFHTAYPTGNYRELQTVCGIVLKQDHGNVKTYYTSPEGTFTRLCKKCFKKIEDKEP